VVKTVCLRTSNKHSRSAVSILEMLRYFLIGCMHGGFIFHRLYGRQAGANAFNFTCCDFSDGTRRAPGAAAAIAAPGRSVTKPDLALSGRKFIREILVKTD